MRHRDNQRIHVPDLLHCLEGDSQIILSGRRINDDMGRYVAESLVKMLIKADIPVKRA